MNNKTSFIEIVKATFAAGESRLFALTGQYFEVIDATFPVDVTLSDFYGAQRGLMKSAEASFNLKGTEFGVIQITSASAQTIRFAYGTGEAGTRRAAGAVSIVGTVPVDLVQADIDAMKVPVLPASHHSVDTAIAAGVAENVFTAAANLNGAIIHSACMTDLAAASSRFSLLAKATAPAAPADGQVILVAQSIPAVAGNWVYGKLETPTRIPAGVGLWFYNTVISGSNAPLRSCRYTLL